MKKKQNASKLESNLLLSTKLYRVDNEKTIKF